MIEVNENEAPIVKRTFDLFLEGEGAKKIAQSLNTDGFRSRQGKQRSMSKKAHASVARGGVSRGVFCFGRAYIFGKFKAAIF